MVDLISVRGARQNNLKNIDVDIRVGELLVVTGVSGSGKSSLVFDTLYAEGQRRYVETFSPYARQFLDRMDKPKVGRIEGIPPAIAIDQVNPVRTSRSTVGTMTEINDHLKLLYARTATLHCRGCGQRVRRDSAQSIADAIDVLLPRPARILVCFDVPVPPKLGGAHIRAELAKQGYTRIHAESKQTLTIIQDRLAPDGADRSRLIEALEAALRACHGRIAIHALDAHGKEIGVHRHSTDLHCATCDLHYQDATPGLYSFNSAIGACETCRGFGRVIGIDYELVIPDGTKTLGGGAVRPWQTKAYRECQDDLERHARKRGIPLDVPWNDLSPEQRSWVIDGTGPWEKKTWYGVRRYFEWLETRAYKMHIRVLLSKYRSYTECPTCRGARLKPDALLWRIGPPPGRTLHELMLLPLDECRAYFAAPTTGQRCDEATQLLHDEIRRRLTFLCDVGLGYLTLDRQSRTLSGGEVQRINLTTALGTSLVNTLFVLDEPSIGLHPRDMGRVIGVLHRLRDAGNTLVVVEHDREIMHQADRILDLGPGAGEHGGRIVCCGTPAEVAAHPGSLTGDWLAGRRQLPELRSTAAAPADAGSIRIEGAAEHNLKNIDVDIPLRRLVCLTGVSGSGKSTLVQDVLYPALLKAKGLPGERAGRHRALVGAELIGKVVLVDQSPIGRTARSNPASYVGAFDAIRTLFAATPDARLRRRTAGTFSFNSGTGRCPECGGKGFEHVEMQFLSDVYLRCSACNGSRYRSDTLTMRLAGQGRSANIAEVLEMTVTEALAFFADSPRVGARLQPLADVGLDYLRLGQPVPTLSGGEAQRLKIAGHLAEAAMSTRVRSTQSGAGGAPAGSLLLFDEPTTGLHFEDIATLIRAFGLLLEAGHSLLVIEHNLDVIRAADWLIDLGPEAGERGGSVVYAGTPAALRRVKGSHTGRALAEDRLIAPGTAAEPAASSYETRPEAPAQISVRGAREHNLKDLAVDIPRERFTVVTGVSGSGKSTLAFDIVFNEGQRRYLESLNAYARQFVQPAARADVDAVHGIPPTVAIEQRTSRGGLRSTVATLTEIYHFIRLLYVRLGTQHCPDCRVAIAPQSLDGITAQLLTRHRHRELQLLAPLIAQRKGQYTELARWAAANGARELRVDGQLVPTDPFPRLKRYVDHTIELPIARLRPDASREHELRAAIERALDAGRGVMHAIGSDGVTSIYSNRRACPQCSRGFPEPDPRLLSFNSPQGWCTQCFGTGVTARGFDAAEHSGEESLWLETGDGERAPCPTCQGKRLNPVALALEFQGRSIVDLTGEPVAELTRWFGRLRLDPRARAIATDALAEIRTRLGFLERVGLGYLTLDRSAPTLSGGEAQRIRLAAQLGSNLKGVCYVLDEPTIGLHPRDNRRLLDALDALGKRHNTLLIVEHDEETIRRADHIIDLGPGAGVRGGRVVATGSAAELEREPASVTGRYLAAPLCHPAAPRRPVDTHTPALELEGIDLHNLHEIDVRIPLGRLVVITGVSGSGKSTLAREVLYPNLQRLCALRGNDAAALTALRHLHGAGQIGRVLEVDQAPIGRTPRSCPATYVGFWDDIRRIYAGSNEARARGYGPGRFSFNSGDGRCPDCQGQGERKVEMSFLPDVKVLCERCGGRRFDRETLEIGWNGLSAADVLTLDVDAAIGHFAAHPRILRPLALLQDVGLGYLTLGQPSPTLSGGEAQRIKLVTELARLAPAARSRASSAPTLYVLDEPTVGLHMADVERLITVLHRLVDAGNSVVIVEHNLDIMAEADWIIDLGPEAGDGGGRIVAAGAPAAIAARTRRSHTGAALAEFLRTRAA